MVVDLPYPTEDLPLLTKAVVDAVDYIYRSSFKHSKAEVLLLDLCHPSEYIDDPTRGVASSGNLQGDGGARSDERVL